MGSNGTDMQLSRRQFLPLVVSPLTLGVAPRVARSQSYPTRPVRILVGFPAGSGPDITARLVGQWLSERFAEPFLVDNRPGAGTNIAMQAVVRSPADGCTLGLIGTSVAINMTFYEKPGYDYLHDITPVASLARAGLVILVDPSFLAKTLPDLIDYARANPGKVNMASTGTGTATHVAGELLKAMTGVNMQHVPYRGSVQAIPDLISGRAQVFFDAVSSSVELINTGRVRALAVTTAVRSEALPTVPTVAEFVPGYEASIWIGFGAPRGTPANVVDEVNKAINAAIEKPGAKTQFAVVGNVPAPMTPAEVGGIMAEETDKWRRVIRSANIRAD
jgi:tripartite-type tricarboxylate transporter receptor subunit TctC